MNPTQFDLAETIAESLQQANLQLGCAKLNLERANLMLYSYKGNPDITAATRHSLDRINHIRNYVDLQITQALQAIGDDIAHMEEDDQ